MDKEYRITKEQCQKGISGVCDGCGCSTTHGVCSNCHEELYILSYQSEFIDSVSDEFADKAQEQSDQVANKLRIGNE